MKKLSVIKLKKKIVSLILSFLFFVWIMPLGAYIKPAFEQLVCNGKRPVCMCTHIKGENKSNNVILKTTGLLPDAYGAPSGSSEFILVLKEGLALDNKWRMIKDSRRQYSYLPVFQIMHVPKASS